MIMAINMYLLHQIAIQIRYVGTRRPGPVDDRVTAFDNDSENENDDVSVTSNSFPFYVFKLYTFACYLLL